jgi:hypothetical protein
MSELKLSGKLISEHCESIISKHPRENLVSLRIQKMQSSIKNAQMSRLPDKEKPKTVKQNQKRNMDSTRPIQGSVPLSEYNDSKSNRNEDIESQD